MIIDAHVHISIYENNARTLRDAFNMLLQEMGKNNISGAIIIPDNIEGSEKIADLKKVIDLIGEHKNLFLLGSPQIIQRGADESVTYQRLLEQGKIKGLKFFPGHDPYYPTDERCLPYYKMCAMLGVPVLFHTGENSGDRDCAKWNDPKYIVEIAKIFPTLKIIITHYYWPQMAYCYEITKNIPNIHFEIAAMADAEVVEKSGGVENVRKILQKTIADRPDHVMFGTDWPMCTIGDHIELVRSLGLSQHINEKIFRTNAMRIYDITCS